jgi:PAS domain S-box-containing protein
VSVSVALASAGVAGIDVINSTPRIAAPTASDIEHFYYNALQNSAAGVIIIAHGGQILHINPEARQLLRRPQAQAGDFFYSLFEDNTAADGVIDVVFQALSDKQAALSAEVTLRRDHDLAHLDVKVSKFRDGNGALQGVVVVINDVTHQHMRATFASIFASGVAVVFFYVSFLGFFSEIMRTTETRTLINSVLMLLPAAGSFYIATQCSLPLEMLGVSFKNWRRHAREAVFLSVLVCAGLTAALFGARLLSSTWAQLPVFAHRDWSSAPFVLGVLLYIALTPLQEFLARGTLQAPLEQAFTGRYRALRAIVIANLLFSVFHEHLGIAFSIMVLLPGLFWGWLFSRQKTLVGVSISHAIIGTYALVVLNLRGFLDVLAH